MTAHAAIVLKAFKLTATKSNKSERNILTSPAAIVMI
jgi:hypothetical protein